MQLESSHRKSPFWVWLSKRNEEIIEYCDEKPAEQFTICAFVSAISLYRVYSGETPDTLASNELPMYLKNSVVKGNHRGMSPRSSRGRRGDRHQTNYGDLDLDPID